MVTYSNHVRVKANPNRRLLQTYDSGIASIFEQQTFDVKIFFVQYVGVLKDILKLDYGSVQTPIVISNVSG
jgi:hypothetical protein